MRTPIGFGAATPAIDVGFGGPASGCPDEMLRAAISRSIHGGRDVPWHDQTTYDSTICRAPLSETKEYALGDERQDPRPRVLPFPKRQ